MSTGHVAAKGPGYPPIDGPREMTFLEMVKYNLDQAGKVAKVDLDILEVIKSCNSALRVNFPLRRTNGKIEVCGVGSAGARPPRARGGAGVVGGVVAPVSVCICVRCGVRIVCARVRECESPPSDGLLPIR